MEMVCKECKHWEVSLAEYPCNTCSRGDAIDVATAPLLFESVIDQEEEKAKETQVGGSHYQLPIQPIDYIVKNNLGYREGNIVKYITRHKNKNGIEDIRKCMHYCQMIIDSYVEGDL